MIEFIFFIDYCPNLFIYMGFYALCTFAYSCIMSRNTGFARHSCPSCLYSLQSLCLPARTLLLVAAEPQVLLHCSRCSYLHIVRASSDPMWWAPSWDLKKRILKLCEFGINISYQTTCMIWQELQKGVINKGCSHFLNFCLTYLSPCG